MLGIQINGDFLDLSPGTSAQMERTSPFFNMDNLAEEFSLPFTFPYTPKNARLLGLPNHFYTRRVKQKISGVKLYDNNNFSYSGELVVQAADLNVNDITRSTISGYFLTGVSSFFQLVKNKKLRQLDLGGVREFIWTNEDPDSPHFGFWQHVHQTLAGTSEYSFAPIRNPNWSGSSEADTPEWMNKLDNVGNLDYAGNYDTLVPQVSLKYLLTQIFEEHGWTFDHSQMPVEWEMLFMPSFFAVTWQKIIQTGVDPFFDYAPLPNIKINLQNHVPPDYFITTLIIDLRNRYNWGFDFESSSRVAKMFPLKYLANGTKKDWTKYMAAGLASEFSEDEKIYAFKNDIDAGDQMGSAPDFTKVTYGDPVETYSDLPAPEEDNLNLVVYVAEDNRYYQVRYVEEDQEYIWETFADNIFNFEPDGNNDSISTGISTMPVYRTLYRTNGLTDYYALFPVCEQEGNWEGKKGEFKPWGVRLLFHRGLVWEANPAGLQGAIKYPCLTSICNTITGVEPDLPWSNVYMHLLNGFEKGIIKYWWSESLSLLKQNEIAKAVLYLPRQELVSFRWTDIIVLKNVAYVVRKLTDVIPFSKEVPVELRRI